MNICLHWGGQTRRHLKNYRRRFDRYISEEGTKIETLYITSKNKNKEEFVRLARDIISLNEERCKSKGYHSAFDKRWVEVAYEIGEMVIYMLDSKVIAGTISTCSEDSQCLHVIAHDNKYNEFNIGNLVLLDTIESAIQREIRFFHFLWGDCEYKSRFLAKEHEMVNITIFKYEKDYKRACCKQKYLYYKNSVSSLCKPMKKRVGRIYRKLYKRLKKY